jgi:Hsp20/alpha crystallin family
MADSTRWESFGGLTTLRREMDRLFERVLGREASSPLGEVEPAIEVADTPAAVIVKAQVPGVSKENLQVNVTDTTLTLNGEVQEEKTTEEKNLPPTGIPLWGVRADHHPADDRPGGASHRPTEGRRLGGDHPEAAGDQSQRRTDSDLRALGVRRGYCFASSTFYTGDSSPWSSGEVMISTPPLASLSTSDSRMARKSWSAPTRWQAL